jgi:hypothetical protein
MAGLLLRYLSILFLKSEYETFEEATEAAQIAAASSDAEACDT